LLEWTGDLSDLVAQTIDTLRLRAADTFNAGISFAGYWSEVIVAERDTRTLHLKTLAPKADGESEWTGSYTDINEIIASEATTIYTDVVDRTATFEVTGMPAGDFSVRAVRISGRAVRAETGPTGIQMGVEVGEAQGFSETILVDQGWQPVSTMFETNPVTGQAWKPSEISALKLALKSK